MRRKKREGGERGSQRIVRVTNARKIGYQEGFLIMVLLSREGWISHGLIGREIISDAIRARTQPRRRVIIVKARLPSLSILFSHHLFSLFLSLAPCYSIESKKPPSSQSLPGDLCCLLSRITCIRDAFRVIKIFARLCKERFCYYFWRYICCNANVVKNTCAKSVNATGH